MRITPVIIIPLAVTARLNQPTIDLKFCMDKASPSYVKEYDQPIHKELKELHECEQFLKDLSDRINTQIESLEFLNERKV